MQLVALVHCTNDKQRTAAAADRGERYTAWREWDWGGILIVRLARAHAVQVGVMDEEKIRLREEVSEQIRALNELKEMGAAHGFDLSRWAALVGVGGGVCWGGGRCDAVRSGAPKKRGAAAWSYVLVPV